MSRRGPGRPRHRRGRAPRRGRPRGGRGGPDGQRPVGRPRPEPGAAGRAARRAARDRARHDGQQGLRLGAEDRRPGGAGGARRRRRGAGGGRDGEHERGAVPAGGRARGLAHGRSPRGRLDGPGRPLVRHERLPHGRHGRERRRRARDHPRGPGRLRRREPAPGRRRDGLRRVPGRDRRRRGAAPPRRPGGGPGRRAPAAGHDGRGPGRPAPGLRPRGLGDRRQRLRHQRRRGGHRGHEPRAAPSRSASPRWPWCAPGPRWAWPRG